MQLLLIDTKLNVHDFMHNNLKKERMPLNKIYNKYKTKPCLPLISYLIQDYKCTVYRSTFKPLIHNDLTCTIVIVGERRSA